MTVRQEIIDNLAARFALIQQGAVFQLPSGPYTCNNNINVVKGWKQNPFNTSELIGIAFRDALTEISYPDFARPLYTIRFGAVAYLSGTAVASRARSILEDMLATVGSSGRCGGLAKSVWPNRVRLNVGIKGDVVGAAMVGFTISYHPRPGTEKEEGLLTAGPDILSAGDIDLSW